MSNNDNEDNNNKYNPNSNIINIGCNKDNLYNDTTNNNNNNNICNLQLMPCRIAYSGNNKLISKYLIVKQDNKNNNNDNNNNKLYSTQLRGRNLTGQIMDI